MSSLARLRAHVGVWSVIAALGLAIAFVASSAGPVYTRIADNSLRQMFAAAPYTERDITTIRPARPAAMGTPQIPAEDLRHGVVRTTPPALRDAIRDSWGYQTTSVVPFDGVGATLTGEGVLGSPHGFAPVVSFHYQPGLADEIDLLEGDLPASDPPGNVIEVMVAAEVAEHIGVTVGRQYALHPGQVVTYPDDPADAGQPVVRISGVFAPRDPHAPVWDHAPLLLRPGTTAIPADTPPLPTTRVALVTDHRFFQLVFTRQLTAEFMPATAVRVRLDEQQLDAAWVPDGIAAVAALNTSRLAEVERQTGLDRLLRGYQEQATSARAVIAITASGLISVLLGLAVLAAGLIAERRRREVELLRARGGSVPTVTGRLAAEALWVVPFAAAAGWLLHVLATGGPGRYMWSPAGLVSALAAAVVATLVVPAAGALVAQRSATLVAVRRDVTAGGSVPGRLTVELSVVLLAVLGVWLMHQRGLAAAGVDPYLSAVPVLLAVGAGLLALRLLPWPVRLMTALMRQLRGVVGFVGLARVGRASSGASLALLVLVLAVAVGGFAGAVNTSVAQARDLAAVQQVGAHVRVEADTLPGQTLMAVAQLPGVTAVVPVRRGGTLTDDASRARQGTIQGPVVVAVDAATYQELLMALGVDARLPDELLAATADGAVVPALASRSVAQREGLALRLGDQQRPLAVVGDVSGLPGPDRGSWVLVPSQALAAPGALTELLVAGADVDPEQVRQVVSALVAPVPVTVSSVADARAALEASGFNDGLTLVFGVGLAGGAAGAVLAVALALVIQARARGRVLSLLRTMGLSNRQARGLLLVELLPVTVLAVAVGAGVGIAMPLLLAPALGLGAFTGGMALGVVVDPATLAGLAGLIGVLVVAGAGIEAAVNRRLGLGGVLRVQ
jgi:putative ABC transport system permease protein